ncbi:hypothetical protein [Flavobacterium sp. UMI-01]|uniref:hypothetical protein n=1 Tax=Flavobacterium sp. UMI-01 TaxID=1441053 RepID=UPI001C7DD8C3|nr:hypothetical protein [Flavobacterium sp. UMI-01]GIZ10013.1 hypothetical protein FUMI01_27390 [Flavobacterium sp. UMI-01]
MNNTAKQELSVDYLMKEFRTSDSQEDFLLVFWFHWVESVTLNDREFQKVSANSAVNHWFLVELTKLEVEFKTYLSTYPDVKGISKDWLYIRCIYKLMSRFPLALLQNAKKRELKPQRNKVAGKKIEFKIFNQN